MPFEPLDPDPEPPTPLVTLETFKLYLDAKKDTNDELLQIILDGTFGQAKRATRRQLGPLPQANDDDDPVTLELAPESRYVRVPDAREITAVTATGPDGSAVTDWTLLRHPDEDSPAPTVDVGVCVYTISITGLFGFTALPDEFRDAIYAHAARNYYERAALYADLTASDEYGSATYLKKLPSRIRETYEAYMAPADQGIRIR